MHCAGATFLWGAPIMLYKKNGLEKLDDNLFRNPTSEYRGTPFWAWNCKLEKDELLRQIDIFKEMGFGGYHIHVRTGMQTKYLSEEYFDLVKSCINKSKENEMLTWLYDEDRWPSGSAGGYVTKDERYRARCLVFTTVPKEEYKIQKQIVISRSMGSRTEKSELLCCYDVVLDEDGYLKEYRRIEKDEEVKGVKWYAYIDVHQPSSWFNNQTYVDTLNKDAIKKFVEITHEAYKKEVSEEFDKTIPAIFTDEPQFTAKGRLNNSNDRSDVFLPWTNDIPQTYQEVYNADIFDTLPELFWDMKDKVSSARYNYHDHISERFAEAFADTCGQWCEENSIALTGHMMEEDSLEKQTGALGDCMRSYRSFHIPGIDVLVNTYAYTTAKQAQSAVHQYGREAMMSELYGATGWDYDFRGHKIQGDWQAALGVTVRVPHLSWVSMEGEAKRDYPASISYQSSWYKEYSYIEDHFSRINTCMTRGKPVVKVAVVHPVESLWLHWGPRDKTSLMNESMDENFKNIATWLLEGSIDFDYISESLLPSLCNKGSNPLKVGEMEYDAVLVPQCETLRSTTFEILEQFASDGGKLIIVGNAPEYENAIESDRGKKLSLLAKCISFDRHDVLMSLEENRTITIRDDNGNLTNNLIYALRQDNDCKWLFVAHDRDPYNKDMSACTNAIITVKGHYVPLIYNTLNGEIYEAEYKYKGDDTVIRKPMFSCDSLLLKLCNGKKEYQKKDNDIVVPMSAYTLPDFVDYTLDEKNVLLLDRCEFKVDDGEWNAKEEVLKADNIARKMLSMPVRIPGIAQPWAVESEIPEHTLTMKFTVNSTIDYEGALLAIERAHEAEIKFNGADVDNTAVGWFVDKSIKTVNLPKIVKGENIIEIKIPIGEKTHTEWMYILGDFGVNVNGKYTEITAMPEKIAFSDLVTQGFPFYGGAITYHVDIETKNGQAEFCVPQYRGAMIKVYVDGKDVGEIVYPPYKILLKDLSDGKHTVDLKLYLTRYNCFGPLHLSKEDNSYHSPIFWRSWGAMWTDGYVLRKTGIFTEPRVIL